MKAMLTIVVELFIEGIDGSYVTNKLAWVIEPAVVLCIPHSRRLVTRRVLSNILPLSVTIGCQINSFVNVVRICGGAVSNLTKAASQILKSYQYF